MATTTVAHRRAPRRVKPIERLRPANVISALVLVLFVGLGTFFLTRASSSPAAGFDHSLGATSAPVVVEEWSDFE